MDNQNDALQHMSQKDKYRAFRNFMTNELGVTKEDIKAWTTEAVTAETSRRIDQMDVEGIVSRAVNEQVRRHLSSSYGKPAEVLVKAVKAEVSNLIAGRLKIDLLPEDPA